MAVHSENSTLEKPTLNAMCTQAPPVLTQRAAQVPVTQSCDYQQTGTPSGVDAGMAPGRAVFKYIPQLCPP